ncbi:MAG: KdsC family phosphatase [Gemmataceae bacterium]
MLLLDVDGVLTDGTIVYADNDVEIKKYHVRDGSGLKLWHNAGKSTGIITGRQSRVVEIRGAELGIKVIRQGVKDKLQVFREILVELSVKPEAVCFVGDDVPDLPVMNNCGLSIAVADACTDVATRAHYVTRTPGGRGAVREVVELLLKSQGKWAEVVAGYDSQKLMPVD